MGNPLFSIVILVRNSVHLLPLCLDTLRSQSEQGFEVLLIGTGSLVHLYDVAHAYPDLSIRVCPSEGTSISEMMNTGVRSAAGTYLQFLHPEDRFLSQHGLSCLSALVQEEKSPDLIYSGALMRDRTGPSEAVSVSLDLGVLQKGTFPLAFRSSCFLKNTLLELGGFDRSFKYRGLFDVACRLFQKKHCALFAADVCSQMENLFGFPPKKSLGMH